MVTWKQIIDVGSYGDDYGKINKLKASYVGDFDLPSGKGTSRHSPLQ